MTILRYVSAAAAGALVALWAVIALVSPASAAVSAPSLAASSHTRLWWDGTTCRAFAAGRIHAMVTDSRHADTYLRVDVALWAHDGKRHAPRVTLGLDRGYVLLDCTTTGD
jgi:hypothetical protein